MIFIAVLLAFAGLTIALAAPNTPRSLASRHNTAARGIFDLPDTDAYLFAHNRVRLLHDAPFLVPPHLCSQPHCIR
jgi:hypothetical protein